MRSLGSALAKVLRPGDTVLLSGELGAGKTTFVQGVAAGLGITALVTSPTFVLVHSYPTSGGWDLLHADVWRLAQLREVVDLALPEQVEQGAALLVEWGERAAPALHSERLRVEIEYEDGAQPAPARDARDAAQGPRHVRFSLSGASWAARRSELRSALEAAEPAHPVLPESC